MVAKESGYKKESIFYTMKSRLPKEVNEYTIQFLRSKDINFLFSTSFLFDKQIYNFVDSLDFYEGLLIRDYPGSLFEFDNSCKKIDYKSFYNYIDYVNNNKKDFDFLCKINEKFDKIETRELDYSMVHMFFVLLNNKQEYSKYYFNKNNKKFVLDEMMNLAKKRIQQGKLKSASYIFLNCDNLFPYNLSPENENNIKLLFKKLFDAGKNIETTLHLKDAGENIEKTLHLKIEYENIIIDLLNKFNLSLSSNGKKDLLSNAIKFGGDKLSDYFIKHKDYLYFADANILNLAIQKKNYPMIEAILTKTSCNISEKDYLVVRTAIKQKDKRALELLRNNRQIDWRYKKGMLVKLLKENFSDEFISETNKQKNNRRHRI